MKIHKTNKLFYRKYPYKIELGVKGAEYLKKFGHDTLVEFCTQLNPPFYFKNRQFTDQNKKDLVAFSKVVSPLLKKNYQTRVETNTLSFYLENEKTYRGLCTKLNGLIKSVTEPASDKDLEKLFSKNFIVMCDALPHGKYGFKVVFNSRIISETRKEALYKWLKNYDDAFFINRTTEYWLKYNDYTYNPIMYVKTSQQLVLLQLFIGDAITRTYEYLLRDTEINTVSEEDTCQP